MSHIAPFVLLVIAIILEPSVSLVMDCDNSTICAGMYYICSDEICEINCNERYACENTFFGCDNSYLHGTCQVNCAGRDGCEAMEVQSYRDTNILCTAGDSCDKMKINIYGLDPNDKITANITSIGGYTDNTHISCHGDGIQECSLDCRDNNDFYSCIEVKFDCYTSGICRYRCESADACCGCAPSCGIFCFPTTYVNELNCYYGDTNCIQEDPGGCVEYYGCIATTVYPTAEPTHIPTTSPTLKPTFNPSVSPTTITTIPTTAPTLIPTPLPTRSPTEHGETTQPSIYPTVSPTRYPTINPTPDPTVHPTEFPTFHPTFNPSVIPTLSPTFRPTDYPTPDVNKADCISITEWIDNLIGVTASDFQTDTQLQNYVMNTTKLVIYEAIKTSHIYDINTLCTHFWRCFYLQLINIRGSTILDIDVCTWYYDVYKALLHKIVDNAEEMGAFMKQGLEHYLIDSITYSGYDNVIINASTQVIFSLITPSPTGSGKVDTLSTDTDSFPSKGVNFANKSSESVVGAVIAVVFVCICLLIVIWSCYQKHNRLERELTETKQRVHALTELTTVEATQHIQEGDIDIEDVEPLNERGEGVSGTGYTVPMCREDRHSVQSHSYGGISAAGDGDIDATPGVIKEEIPDLIDEEEESLDDDEDEEESSDDDEEVDALYMKQRKSSEDLYGKGTTTGDEETTTYTGGNKDDNDENQQ